MNSTGHHYAARLRYLAAAVIACAGLLTMAAAASAAAPSTSRTSMALFIRSSASAAPGLAP